MRRTGRMRPVTAVTAVIGVALAAALGELAWTQNAMAATIHVPADYSTIQSAIAAAAAGDEIVASSGIYEETIDLLGKAITLRSEHGPLATIIDGAASMGTVVTCASGEGPETIIQGFTIRGGAGTTIAEARVGGGMYLSGGSPTVTNCILRDNAATYGGGAYNTGGSPLFTNCLFLQNVVSSESGPSAAGAAMWNGGGGNPIVINCTFTENAALGVGAPSGGALYSTAARDGGDGGIVRLSNCILWNDLPDEIAEAVDATAIASYCDVQGGWPGPGNIDADPLFADPVEGNYRLGSESPCVNKGVNNAVPLDHADLDEDGDTAERTPEDLNGSPRFAAGPVDPEFGGAGCGLPIVVDIGAYEAAGQSINPLRATDLDGDLLVGFADLLVMLNSWGVCGGCCLADIDYNGTVDFGDLLTLLFEWG